MPDDSDKERIKRRWEIFRGWNGDPEFWRGIWSNVVSAAIVAGLVYTVGVLAGYFKYHRQVGLLVVFFVTYTFVYYLSAWLVLKVYPHNSKHPKFWNALFFVFNSGLNIVVSAAVGFGVVDLFL